MTPVTNTVARTRQLTINARRIFKELSLETVASLSYRVNGPNSFVAKFCSLTPISETHP